MKYRQYDNNYNYLILGILLFFLFGGFQLIFFVLIPLFFRLLPLLIILYLVFRVFGNVRLNQKLGAYAYRNSNERSEFVELLIRVLCLGVQVDGKVDPRELISIENLFRIQFKYSSLQMTWVKDLINHALKNPSNLDDVTSEINQKFDYQSKLLLLQMVYQVVLADQKVESSEESFIRRVVQKLHILEHDATSIRGHFIKEDNDEKYYAVLGLSKGATLQEVKSSYKELCKKYHPDRLQHLGEEFKSVSEDKIKEINEAYGILKKKLK